MTMVVFPSDYFKRNKVDEHFADEYQAAKQRGFLTAFYNHDKIIEKDNDQALFIQAGHQPYRAILRGWMLTVEQYTFLFNCLKEQGITLIVSPEQYQTSHYLPGWYPTVSQFTAASVFTQGDDVDQLISQAKSLPEGQGFLKDYVKSVKHITEACLVKDVHSQDSIISTVEAFKSHAPAGVQGGFVLREWMNITGPEWRSWWVDGECRLFTAHPDTPDQQPDDQPDISFVTSKIRELKVPFLTVDWVKTDQGWKIMEIGNGSVSDRPRSISAQNFLVTLF